MKLISNKKTFLITAIAMVALFLIWSDKASAGNRDCNLRIFDGVENVEIQCHTPDSVNPLRIAKGGVVYGLSLVDTTDTCASRIRIKTANQGIQSLKKSGCVYPMACKANITDNNFQSCIAGTLAKNWADVTDADMAGLSGTLDCNNSSISNINGARCLSGLTDLILNNNLLTSIPPEIGNLSNLTKLYLQYNQLASIPAEIGGLVSLKYFHISNNLLTSIPSTIGSLGNLENLYLGNNQLDSTLSSIPAEIGNLNSLIDLSINNNLLTSIPPAIGSLGNLRLLRIYNNQINSIPAEIGGLVSLTYLSLYNNQLNSLPTQIGSLNSLETLYLQDNQINSIPAEIGGLASLTKLNLKNNLLPALPTQIGNLTSLTELYLYNNSSLDSIPSAQAGMNLDILNISGTGPGLTCSHLNVPSWNATLCSD